MNYTELIERRVVLRCKNNMTFAGKFMGLVQGEKEYLQVQTDQKSGFCILCPQDFVEELIHVPITQL